MASFFQIHNFHLREGENISDAFKRLSVERKWGSKLKNRKLKAFQTAVGVAVAGLKFDDLDTLQDIIRRASLELVCQRQSPLDRWMSGCFRPRSSK
jgi:hypothetical protein